MQMRRKPGTVSQTTRQAQARRLARIIQLKPKTDTTERGDRELKKAS